MDVLHCVVEVDVDLNAEIVVPDEGLGVKLCERLLWCGCSLSLHLPLPRMVVRVRTLWVCKSSCKVNEGVLSVPSRYCS